MSEKWFYVLDGDSKGPVAKEELLTLMEEGSLGSRDYVWRKGFDNWKKIEAVEELQVSPEPALDLPEPMAMPAPIEEKPIDLSECDRNEKVFFIKTGADRGAQEVEYGPFSLTLLKKLYDENRINGKTFVFSGKMGQMKNWMPLGDLAGFEEVFNDAPPAIKDEDRRAFRRRPFIARMFIQNENKVFEGICRDVSVGGMQVLVDNFPIEVGKRISINAHPENSDYHFTASGEIVRKLEGGLGFSFRFINLSDEAVKAINSYTAQE